MKLKRTFVFIALVVLFAVAGVVARRVELSPGYEGRAYTLRSQIYHHGRATGECIVYMFSNGDYRERKHDGDHIYGSMRVKGTGFFIIDESGQWMRKDDRVRSDLSVTVPTLQDLRNRPDYVKDDTLLGATAVVNREVSPSTGKPIVEVWRAPDATGFWTLKMISYDENTGEEELRVEPVSLDFAEPDRALLTLPNYRVGKPIEKPSQ